MKNTKFLRFEYENEINNEIKLNLTLILKPNLNLNLNPKNYLKLELLFNGVVVPFKYPNLLDLQPFDVVMSWMVTMKPA